MQTLQETYADSSVQWLELPWKLILSNKGLLPLLWTMYPEHDNLLPAFWDEQGVRGYKPATKEVWYVRAECFFVLGRVPCIATVMFQTLVVAPFSPTPCPKEPLTCKETRSVPQDVSWVAKPIYGREGCGIPHSRLHPSVYMEADQALRGNDERYKQTYHPSGVVRNREKDWVPSSDGTGLDTFFVRFGRTRGIVDLVSTHASTLGRCTVSTERTSGPFSSIRSCPWAVVLFGSTLL